MWCVQEDMAVTVTNTKQSLPQCVWEKVYLTDYGFFLWSCTDVRVGLQRKLNAEELMLLNCGVGKDPWESLGLQGDQSSQSSRTVYIQSWILIGRTDAEAETPILWPPDAKNWLIGKDPAVGKDWRWEEKGTTEDEMVGWHHCLDEHEFEQAPGVGDGQGSLACCSPWGHKELDMTDQLNWTEQNRSFKNLVWETIPVPCSRNTS